MTETIIDDDQLRQYLAESLPGEQMARVEKALRDSSQLRERLESVRHDRTDPTLHTLGAIWRRSRLTCVTREQLGSYLLDVLDPAQTEYISFHLEVIECPFCRANLADLRGKADPMTPSASQTRRKRIFHSSRHLLPGEE
jgi:hypothetical protein